VTALLIKEGFEVTCLDLYNTPERVVQSVLREDAAVIVIGSLSGEHLTLTPSISDKMSGSVNEYYERRRE
jgi:methylmalonyl-CoA mutase cobalamin-binding domain/chain